MQELSPRDGISSNWDLEIAPSHYAKWFKELSLVSTEILALKYVFAKDNSDVQ